MGNDLTEEFRLKEEIEHQQVQLLNASKLSSLGEMAGGIAHEINNPLAIINAAAARIQRFHKPDPNRDDDPIAHSVNLVENTVDRISKIVKGLRTFARDGEQDPMVRIPIANAIDDTLGLCQERLRNNGVKLEMMEFDRTIAINCRPVQISQILLNLINNAFDAVKDRDQKWIRLEVSTADNNVHIAVIDSGTGIPEEVAKKIMQPFFTTKIVNKGTGLGLSISNTLAIEHGGHLKLCPGTANTTFVLTLPLAASKKRVA